MHLGVLLSPLPASAEPQALGRQAVHFEQLGYHTLWTAQASGRGFMMTDPLLALATAAAVTDRIRLGTAVLQLPLYQPAALAHSIFSLQQLCGDRLLLGLGTGSTATDFAVFGQSFEQRFKRFNQSLVEFKQLLKGEDSTIALTPWPEVSGGPPLLLGSWGNNVETAAREFDGWIASAHYRSHSEIALAAGAYHKAGGQQAIVSTIQLDKNTDLGELRDRLLAFADVGFKEAAVMFLPGGPDPEQVIQLLE